MHHFGFLPDAVYDYDLPAHQRKPFPFALEDIMRRFDIQAHEMLLVDDMKLGWDMAQSAGVQTAYAAWNKAEFPELTEQMRGIFNYFFDSTKELEKFLFD
jgi:phosphoglycolate phosphatase/pyrophosphatase PpaX